MEQIRELSPRLGTRMTDSLYLSPRSAYWLGEVPDFSKQMDRMDEADEQDGSCGKGIIVALSLEAGASLLLYAIWQAWHFIR
jgi:hypothetical protein